MVINDLRSAPGFAAIIADRCWREWWMKTDVTLSEYRCGIERMATGGGIPTALVAHDGAQYVGSVLLVENDFEARPRHWPWIAALWVEPAFRRRGVAAKLIQAARAEAGRLGHSTCYLCATDANSPYYLARGFRLLESAVAGLNIFDI